MPMWMCIGRRIAAPWLFSNEAEDSTSCQSVRKSSVSALKKPIPEKSIGLTTLLAGSEGSSVEDHSPPPFRVGKRMKPRPKSGGH